MSYGQHVVIYVESVSGSSRVDYGKEGSILFATHLSIDGEGVYTDGEVRLRLSGSESFVYLELPQPTEEAQLAWAELNRKHNQSCRKLHGPIYLKDGKAQPLHERFSLDEVNYGSSEKCVSLAVRSIEFVERPLTGYINDEYDPVSLRVALRASQDPEKEVVT